MTDWTQLTADWTQLTGDGTNCLEDTTILSTINNFVHCDGYLFNIVVGSKFCYDLLFFKITVTHLFFGYFCLQIGENKFDRTKADFN